MEEDEEIAIRLQTAHSRWGTALGTFRTWRHSELTTRAFRDWHGLDEPAQSSESLSGSTILVTAVRTDAEPNQDSCVEHVLRVCAAENGRQRRAEVVSRTGEEWMSDLVVVDEPWFWARKDHDVQTNGGDPRSSHGGADFVLLLRPNAVPDGFDLRITGEIETVAGRACDVVIATPKGAGAQGERLPGPEVFGMVGGGRDFRLCVDRRTSTLMRVTKLVNGEPAEIAEFLDIAFDEPVGVGTFQPLV